jgi:3-hydroxybutyryl-CoA dehydrogenase
MNPQRVGVVGLGLLGRGITACFLGHGFEVVAFARNEQTHAAVREHIEQMMDELVDLGGFDAGLRQSWPARYFPTTDYAALRDCSFVVESVLEDIAIKHEVFDQIEAEVSSATIIASNSSAIPITQLQQRRQHPERFLAMHWAEPAHATRFMEIIRGERTSEATIQTTLSLARRLGKEPSLLQKEIPGFIANRIGYAMYREALSLLDSGVADAETIDRSVRNALGLWATVCGPLRWIDLTGGPELYAKAVQHVLPTLNNSTELPPVLKKLTQTGARGIVNGRGFYNYTPEEARCWEELYRRHAWRVAQMQNEYFPVKDNPS